VLGRGDDCDLTVPDPKVSRRHAAVEPLPDGRASLVDLGSGNGTFVNGRQVTSEVLDGNEQIQVGDTVIVTSRGDAPDGGTVIGVAAPVERQSTIQRLVKRSTRRAMILSGAAVAAALALGVMLATGVIGGSEGTNEAVKQVVEAAEPATVSIDVGTSGGGTGWVLDADRGLIVTNAHVVDGRAKVDLGVNGRLRQATLVGVAPCEDLAVLRVSESPDLRALPLGRQSEIELGETVVAVGYPADASLEANLTSTTGVVSVVRSAYRERSLDLPRFSNVVQTDAAINPGSSGGPLLNLEGKLIGVNSAGRTLTPDGRIVQGQNYAIGVERVQEVVDVLRDGRSIGWLGIGFDYLSPEELGRRGLPPGLVIERVAPGSSAARAGLDQDSGLLVAVNGQPVDNSLASYCDAVDGLSAGRSATLSILAPGASRPSRVRMALE